MKFFGSGFGFTTFFLGCLGLLGSSSSVTTIKGFFVLDLTTGLYIFPEAFLLILRLDRLVSVIFTIGVVSALFIPSDSIPFVLSNTVAGEETCSSTSENAQT